MGSSGMRFICESTDRPAPPLGYRSRSSFVKNARLVAIEENILVNL